MADTVEEIKARLDIHEVVGSYVQLKKAGRNYKGLCPFHSEKTPSFVVSPEKQICHCFGCNKGGDIFSFIEEIEGVDFSEALQILADRAGVKIDNIGKFNKGKSGEKDEYYKAHNLACEFFEKQLFKTNDGAKVLEYLKKRGLKEETIREFRIGFAPNKFDVLHPLLLKKGINKRVLIKSGLVSSKGIADDKVYDKFRGRLMFPIFNYLGKVCGFGGRVLKKDQMPKYLNSPENPIYNKSRVLYGLYHSKSAVKEKDQIILTEGYFDVILPYQEGIRNIAAVSGIALTSDQATLIKRLTTNAVTCFDLDDAGFNATKRSYEILANEDIIVKTVSGFEGKDPADLVCDKGGKEFEKFVKNAQDFILFYVEKLIGLSDITVMEGRRSVISNMLPLIKKMSPVNKDFYIRELSKKLNIKELYLYDEIENYSLPKEHPARTEANPGVKKEFNISEILIAIVLDNPYMFKIVLEKVVEGGFENEEKDVYKALCDQYNSVRKSFKEWDFSKGVLANYREKIDVLLLYAEEKYGYISEESLEEEVEKLIDKMKKTRKSKRLREIQSEISEVEKSGKKAELIKLLQLQQELLSD